MSTSQDFPTYIENAWNQHAHDPQAVAESFRQAQALISKSEEIPQLAQIVSHVFGDHLRSFKKGRQVLGELKKLKYGTPETLAALDRYDRGLTVASGDESALTGLAEGEQARVLGLAASALVNHDISRCEALLFRAEAQAENLPDADPAVRSIAVTANNLACAIEENPHRTSFETGLMIRAAQMARRYWERSGTWLQVERAEYRLANSYLQAGDPERALEHAQECLRICQANNADTEEIQFAEDCIRTIRGAQGEMQPIGASPS